MILIGVHGGSSLFLPWLDMHVVLVTLCVIEAIDTKIAKRRQQSLRLYGIYPGFFSFDQRKKKFIHTYNAPTYSPVSSQTFMPG